MFDFDLLDTEGLSFTYFAFGEVCALGAYYDPQGYCSMVSLGT